AHLRVHAGVAVRVVGLALVGLAEDLVGFLRLLELLLGVLVVRIAVRVELHRELAIGLLDVVLGRILVHAEDFVVVALLGRHQVSRSFMRKRGPIFRSGPIAVPLPEELSGGSPSAQMIASLLAISLRRSSYP